MKVRLTIQVLFLTGAVGVLSSCGVFSSKTTTHLLYVSTGQGIYGYRIDNKSGTSSPLPSAPFYAGNTPAGMVIDASGKRMYLANQTDNTISLLTIDHSSGVLTEVMPRTATGGFSPNQILLDSGGTTLFVANQLSNTVTALSIGSNGALTAPTASQAAQIGSPPANLAFGGGLLFVAAPSFSQVFVYSVSSGNLTAVGGSPFSMTDGVGSVTVDSSAKYLYVTNPSINTTSGFTIQYSSSTNTMGLTPIPGSPFSPNASTGTAPSQPMRAILDSTAAHLYVANNGSSNVSLFSVGSNGALTSMTTPTAPAGSNPLPMLIDPNGSYLLVGNVGGRSVSELSIKADGTLGAAQTISVPSVPQALAVTK
jgi:6-phosphogluconolactonase (cycloisomerase 2 family)